MPDSFFKSYLSYLGETEVPAGFNRWAAIVGLGSLLEKNMWFDFGADHIFPNQYVMLIGSAGTRKGTAIKSIQRLLKGAGLTKWNSERTSKEKFLLDLEGEDSGPLQDNVLERNLDFQDNTSIHPMNIYVDEANDFFGINNMEFISILGSLWDWPSDKPYTNAIKSGKSVSISRPSVSIIAGNTPTGFTAAFPPEIIGQGFFSRILLIYGEPNGRRITWPRTPDPHQTGELIRQLQFIRGISYPVSVPCSRSAKDALDTIYQSTRRGGDSRFDSYYNRRFTHLLKLSLICTAANFRSEVGASEVIEANTYLSYAEGLMPKALGEFGRARNSDVTHKVMALIESLDGCPAKTLFKEVTKDLEKPSDLGDILRKLVANEKIFSHGVPAVYYAVRKQRMESTDGLIDTSYLTEEELSVGEGKL